MGNRTSATEASGRTVSWSYDGVNRLTSEAIAQDPAGRNGSVSYTLDPVGNRLAAASTLPGVASSAATYSADDLLSTESYDLNGNVLSTGGRSFTYDSEDRLVAMSGGAAGSQVAIQYDGWGNRVAETANGATTRYLVDDLNPTGYPQVVEELVNGAVTRRYAYGLQRIDENQSINNAWTPSFYGYDGGGSVRQLTNPAGAVTDTYSYDAFGNLLSSTGTTPNHYLYRGEQYDQALDLYYLRARHYNPTTGRFMGRDAADGDLETPASLHKYAYASGDPVNRVDPSGNDDAVDYPTVTLNISVSRVVITALKITAAAIACLDLYDATKLHASTTGGPESVVVPGVIPCTAVAYRKGKPWPYPVPKGEPVPGTQASPRLPRCDQLRAAVTTAKVVVGGLGKCVIGMTLPQLNLRLEAWTALGIARAVEDKVCWNGGDYDHQDAEAIAWTHAGNCAAIISISW